MNDFNDLSIEEFNLSPIDTIIENSNSKECLIKYHEYKIALYKDYMNFHKNKLKELNKNKK